MGRQVTQERFYDLCEALKKNKDAFMATRETMPDSAARMSAILGYKVNVHALRGAMRATGIEWFAPRTTGGASPKSIANNSTRTIAKALKKLYDEIGATPSDSLVQLAASFD